MATILAIIIGGFAGGYIGEAPYVDHYVPEEKVYIVDTLPQGN